jgi:hypothetical protein
MSLEYTTPPTPPSFIFSLHVWDPRTFGLECILSLFAYKGVPAVMQCTRSRRSMFSQSETCFLFHKKVPQLHGGGHGERHDNQAMPGPSSTRNQRVTTLVSE